MIQKIEIYPISIEPMKEGGYFAECALLQGCHAEGDTFAEAISNIQDVIRVHKECRQNHNEIVPSIAFSKPARFNINIPLPLHATQNVS